LKFASRNDVLYFLSTAVIHSLMEMLSAELNPLKPGALYLPDCNPSLTDRRSA